MHYRYRIGCLSEKHATRHATTEDWLTTILIIGLTGLLFLSISFDQETRNLVTALGDVGRAIVGDDPVPFVYMIIITILFFELALLIERVEGRKNERGSWPPGCSSRL